ncbi:hypothetical protein K3495_g7720 [Podosphaera aphanis]|nr:hypothetical protein K3495_g7720 [Podosphaera aphanis]
MHEDFPGYAMPLTSKIHDFLDSRGYLAFTLNNKPQVQPSQLLQGSKGATFGFNQCMNIALGALPKLPSNIKTGDSSDGCTPSLLLHKEIDNEDLKFYMDDRFCAYSSFQAGFSHLQFHLLPRIA